MKLRSLSIRPDICLVLDRSVCTEVLALHYPIGVEHIILAQIQENLLPSSETDSQS